MALQPVHPESRLFQPLRLGKSMLGHRIVLAPLTRNRNHADNTPNVELLSEYYLQRAAMPGTLLITEATLVTRKTGFHTHVPGIWNSAHVEEWKKITDAVHKKGSLIYMQLWSLGRVVSAETMKTVNLDVVGAGDIPMENGDKPRPLKEDEILEVIECFKQAAHKAVHEANFDGVEIHGANGYLVDQFLQTVTNNRTDNWGGSIPNRSRFAIEVAKAVASAVGPDRTGIRLSPYSTYQSMGMPDPKPQFKHVIEELAKLNLAFIHLIESPPFVYEKKESPPHQTLDFAFEAWKNRPIILNGGYTAERAYQVTDKSRAHQEVAVAFGRHFISNPDIVFRIKYGIPFSPYDFSTFYTNEPKGYIDYPFSEQYIKAKENGAITA